MKAVHALKTGLALAALVALVGAARAQSVNGPSWSGYTATGKTFTRISARWREPTVQCTLGDARVSIWVGFGGDETLQQDGVIAVCNGVGAPRFYKAWWEMFRPGSTPSPGDEPFTVSSGDNIEASVEYKDGSVTLEVKDKTNGGHFTSVRPCGAGCPRSSAAWIVERPGAGRYPLADYGSVKLTRVKARGDRDADADERSGRGLAYTNNVMVRLGHPLSDCGDIRSDDDGDGKSFTCTWRAAK
jgi:hypothetical protein